MDDLNAIILNVTRKQRLLKKEEQIQKLKNEQINTNLFNGKRRRVIQEQINDLINEWFNIRYNDQENKFEEIKMLVPIKILKDRINIIDDQIKKIML